MPELPDIDTIFGWRGRTVFDRKGEKVGKVGELYLDQTDRPAYAGVRTGLFGHHESIVPLEGVVERDGDLVLPHDAELVRDAPKLEPEGALEDAEEERLARHYTGRAPDERDGLDERGAAVAVSEGGQPLADDELEDERVGERVEGEVAEGSRPEGGNVETETAGEMVRSEEEVVTGTTEMRPAERVRLRKVVVTDHVTRTVPVQREEIRLETDPPPRGDVQSVEDVE